ncbi:MAG: RluA family pseudouridine synthase [Myxococcota bacterium]
MNSLSSAELEARSLYRKGGLWVLNKPYDLPTSGRSLADPDCLQAQLIEQHGDMVWAVHQLDADTTGLNLFVTEKRLVHVFKQRMTWPLCVKTYLAVLHGIPDRDEIHQEAPIGDHPEDARRGLGVNPNGRSASTHFEIVDRGKDVCLARVRIETGRTHQIRIHAADMGHPLVGEEWYREPACSLHPRQALHAHCLSFRDGRDEDEPREFEAPIPEDLLDLCDGLGLDLSLLA